LLAHEWSLARSTEFVRAIRPHPVVTVDAVIVSPPARGVRVVAYDSGNITSVSN
jgi:hypothetical protein